MNNEEERRNWLMHLMNYYGTYHHHKENMAWVATALFIPSIISFAFAVGHIGNEHHICQMIFSVFVIIPFIMLAGAWAMCFVLWQFGKRSVAAQNALNTYNRLKGKYGEDEFIKVDDPPEVNESKVLSCVAILGATVVAVLIVGVGIH